MADINKELNDIKNAVYGIDVRGSIHDGIDKINKESEHSKEKAIEAHDVMESIINDGFDNAALESNFEQKLDDKIANLQPEWTGFKDNIETQLAEKAKQSELNQLNNIKADKTYVDNLFENLGQLEVKGSYNSVSALSNAYPNGTSGLFEVSGSLYAWNGSEWVRVFDLEVMPWACFLTTENEDWSVA